MADVNLDFVERYVALWNEPDPEARRRTIEDMFAPDGANYTPSIRAIGADALDARVTSSYEKFIEPGKYLFRTHAPAVGHNGAVKVTWEMVTVPGDEVVSIGVEFLVLDDQGRIASDHQFVIQ
jgi:hypothetical protein